MNIGDVYISKLSAAVGGVVVVLLLLAGLYFGGAFSGNSSSNKAGTLPKAATEAPTIETGTGATNRVSGFKLSVQVSLTPEIKAGTWAVSVAVQGGKNRSQTLGTSRLSPDKPFVVSNNADGAYTITPSILNCSKDCSASALGYTLPPLTIPPKRNATVIIVPKCVKSPIPLGIDCTRSQVLSSYK